MKTIFSSLIPETTSVTREQIANVLSEFPPGVLSLLAEKNCIFRPLDKSERYDTASPALARLKVDVDAWSTPADGLFVVEERTVYLRGRSRMTIVHESMHAFDCALGNGVYRSGKSAELHDLFHGAQAFVTPYAAMGLDEYFAESCRGYMGDFNDATSHWPRATRARLKRVDTAMHDYLERLFGEIAKYDPGTQLEMVL